MIGTSQECKRDDATNGRRLFGERAFVFLVLFVSFALTPLARAADRQVLRGHVPGAVTRLAPLERLSDSQRLHLAIGLPLRNRDALTNLLQQIYNPASPSFRQYLTPEQFTARFGPTEQDYDAVIDFAKANGLVVKARHPNRVVLDVEGAVKDIEKAFHLTMRLYQHPKESRKFYAPDAEPSMDLAAKVLHISGLDDYAIPHLNLKARPASKTANVLAYTGSGPVGTYLGNDFRAAYAPGTSLTGTGQSVGLLEFDAYYASDIAAYETLAGLPHVPLENVAIAGGFGTPGSNNVEVCLDIEMVISMASGISKIYVYEAPLSIDFWDDLLSRMANDNLAKQLSCSWGGGPPDATAEAIFQQMAAQGQSFFNASGDDDAFAADVPFPGDSPNITQVGATTLTTTGPGGGWTAETVWQEHGGTGSGGGVSTYYDIPEWQLGIGTTANQGSAAKRNIPDVALAGDNVFVIADNGRSNLVVGTSCAAPLWAGYTALVNQQAAASGKPPVGFMNPSLYAIGKGDYGDYAAAFHDVTTGNNFNDESPDRFSAVTGYDLCTGWGTPTGDGLINLLAHVSRIAIYGAETDFNNNDVKTKILASGALGPSQIKVFRVGNDLPIPTLANLRQYNAVLVYSNDRYTDATALGNALADYVDEGGGVVIATHSFSADGFSGLGGRIMTPAYSPFTPGAPRFSPHLTLIKDLPEHLLMQNISGFDGGVQSTRDAVTLTGAATLVAHWSDGTPLLATAEPAGSRVVGLNFWPPSSDSDYFGWRVDTDGGRLMANALLWAAAGELRIPVTPCSAPPITFDDLAAPADFPETTRLTNQIDAPVTFAGPGRRDGGAVLRDNSNFRVTGYSGRNFLAFNTAGVMSDGGIPRGPETISFAAPMASVRLLAGTGLDPGHTLTMRAYDANQVLLASSSIVLAAQMAPVQVMANGIQSVVVSTTSPTLVLDDLGFVPACAQPQIMAATLHRLSAGQCGFAVSGRMGATYEIQVSSDLRNWSRLTSLTMTNTTTDFMDTSTNAVLRFYRASVMP